MRGSCLLLAGIVLAALAGPARAQSGDVVVYLFAGEHVQPTVQAFQKKYPKITVHAVTLQGPAMVARLRAERANPRCDVLDTSVEQLLANSDMLEPYTSQYAAAFPDWAVIRKDGQTYAYAYTIAMQAFAINTSLMKVADAPHSWKDLLEPRYKGKFLVGNPALTTAGYDSYAQILQIVGPDKIKTYIDNAVFTPETNLVPQQVGRGEEPIGLVEETKTQDLIDNGYPVTMIYPAEGMVPTLDGAALVRNRPHPENGLLFAEFLNSKEGQNINVAARNRRVGRTDANPPRNLPPTASLKINTAVSTDRMMAEHEANIALFNKYFSQH